MDFLYDPLEIDNERNDLKPLVFDDEEDDIEDYYSYDDASDNAYDAFVEEYEEPGLGGFDDLKPFGSFNNGFGWDDTLF